ncbi:MAG TPA: TetR/AcrR family transcriptional regulator [Solirubrobacteraceae bacterium]|jgi:AcrR family transcriptional regulator|nr:TetR/AcrR family transcriptional regulator [Solirubrobacteraceae bacterium]
MSYSQPLIRPPLQRRSQESLERVLQAGFELLQERGFEGFTLQEVSQRANVSIGSIYARVPSREALIMAVYERAMLWTEEQAGPLERAAHRPGTTREQIEAIATEAATQVLTHDDVLRVFMRQAPLEPWIMERAAVKSQATCQVFTHAILEHREEIRHDDPELAADIAWRLVYNTTARRITHGPAFESEHPVGDQVLARELARAVADYLL